jgi:exopolysaccharide biosynthesis polyprenyl glycosylphosphotransferase
MILDLGSIASAWFLATIYGTPIDSIWTSNTSFLCLILAVSIGFIASQELYRPGDRRRNYGKLVQAVSLAALVLLLIAFLYEPARYVSRSTFVLFWALSLVFTCVSRFGFDLSTKFVRKRNIIRHPVFLILDDENEPKYRNLMSGIGYYNVLGVANASALDLKTRQETLTLMQDLGVTEAFVSWGAIRNRIHLCWLFQTLGITVRILPVESEYFFPNSEFSVIGNIACLTFPTPVIIGGDYWVKRCFDFCFAFCLITLLLPVYIAIAILIKLDSPGQIFFRQNRIGLHNRPFKVWKFRTMVANADKLQAKLEADNENKDGVLFKMKDDPRITRIGRTLRRYSLDELPQLFNILLGEMSLVGPRPLPTRDVERFTNRHFIRQEVLPGITGLWQVSGRSTIDNFEDVVNLDMAYITNWSLWLDLQIILKTVKVVLNQSGAY